jgi:hypothetical protein
MFVNGSGQNKQFHRGPSIDASCQVSVHLANQFQRRRFKCEKLTDDRCQVMVKGKSSHCLWQGEIRRGVNNRKYINLGILYGQQQTHELNNPTYIHYNLDTCTW